MKGKKQFTLFMTAVLAAGLTGSYAMAADKTFSIGVESENEDDWNSVAMANDDTVTTGACIRKAADEDSSAVGYLYRGGAVRVLHRGEEWTEVASGGIKGYIKNEYLTYGSEAKGLAEYYGDYGVRASWDDVNVFAADDSAAKIVGTAKDGDTYPVVSKNGSWLEISTGVEETAFVSDDDVSLVILVDSALSVDEKENTAAAAGGKTSSKKTAAGSGAVAAKAAAGSGAAAAKAAAGSGAVAAKAAATPAKEASAAKSSEADGASGESDTEDASYSEEVSYSDASYESYAEDTSYSDESYSDASYESYTEDVSYDSYTEDYSYSDDSYSDASYESYTEDASYDSYTEDYSYSEDTSSYDSYTDDTSYDDSYSDASYESYTDDTTYSDDSYSDDSYYEDTVTDESYTEEYSYSDASYEDASYSEDMSSYDSYSEDTSSYDSYTEESTSDTSYDDGTSSQSSSDLDLLAALIYCEAGNQPYDGQVAVGAVVMNRVNSGSFPGSISEVIYQSGQFTPAYSGALASALASGAGSSYIDAASAAMAGSDPTGGALYFNTSHGSGTKIGDHWFY